jgi:3-oxoacyl-[acyl-carrier protein] reductase
LIPQKISGERRRHDPELIIENRPRRSPQRVLAPYENGIYIALQFTQVREDDSAGNFIMNSVALVTGGGRGIGRGISIELAKLGYDLIINYVANREAAQQTRKDCLKAAKVKRKKIRAEICRADVGTRSGREKLVAYARKKFDRLDLLVNNAGIPPRVRQDLLDASEESFDDVLSTNLKGPYFLTQLAAKWMIEELSANPDRRLNVVFIGSISADAASLNRGEYCISKAGLSMAAKLYATRLAEHGINVYEIRPGIIETDMVASAKEKYDKLIHNGISPIRRWGTPEDVGKVVAAIAQGLLPFSTGEVIYVDGGLHIQRL